jgi:hypothetical protein
MREITLCARVQPLKSWSALCLPRSDCSSIACDIWAVEFEWNLYAELRHEILFRCAGEDINSLQIWDGRTRGSNIHHRRRWHKSNGGELPIWKSLSSSMARAKVIQCNMCSTSIMSLSPLPTHTHKCHSTSVKINFIYFLRSLSRTHTQLMREKSFII